MLLIGLLLLLLLRPLLGLVFNVVPAPAKRVKASAQLSTGRVHASTDQGTLSYILQMGRNAWDCELETK